MDAPDIINRNRLINPLCFGLKSLTHLHERFNLLTRRFGNQHLPADGIGLDTRRQVDGASHDAILGPDVGANIAHHHFAGIDANSHFDFG